MASACTTFRSVADGGVDLVMIRFDVGKGQPDAARELIEFVFLGPAFFTVRFRCNEWSMSPQSRSHRKARTNAATDSPTMIRTLDSGGQDPKNPDTAANRLCSITLATCC